MLCGFTKRVVHGPPGMHLEEWSESALASGESVLKRNGAPEKIAFEGYVSLL
jgi:hypothetical protein